MSLVIGQNTIDSYERNRQIYPKIATVFYFALLVLLFFFWKLSKPIEIEEGEGLLVDFGYTEVGLGEDEPDKDNPMNKIAIPSPGNPPLTQDIKEKVIVQDYEETEKIDAITETKSQKVVVVDNILKSPNKKPEKVDPIPSKNISNAPPAEKNKVDENSLFKGFKGNGSGTGSQGNTAGEGNMGDPSGSKSDNYLGKSTGLGSEGEGRGRIGSGLIGRNLKSIPPIVDKSNKTGKIIISVNVGADGAVKKSEFVAMGSSITDSELVNKCMQAAKKAKFSPSDEKDSDWGKLVFTFEIRD
jgi:outer membrane biosynthesis protein TonB